MVNSHFIQRNNAPHTEDYDRIIDVISGGYAAGGHLKIQKSYMLEKCFTWIQIGNAGTHLQLFISPMMILEKDY